MPRDIPNRIDLLKRHENEAKGQGYDTMQNDPIASFAWQTGDNNYWESDPGQAKNTNVAQNEIARFPMTKQYNA